MRLQEHPSDDVRVSAPPILVTKHPFSGPTLAEQQRSPADSQLGKRLARGNADLSPVSVEKALVSFEEQREVNPPAFHPCAEQP